MGIKERKKQEQELLRNRILNAAEKTFVEEGFEKITMRKLADMIEYSPTTIYRFFNNKDDLLKTLLTKTYEEINVLFKNIKNENHLNETDTLKSLIKEYVVFFIQNPNTFKLFTSFSNIEMENNHIYEVIGNKKFRIFYSWKDCLEKLSDQGSLKEYDVNSGLFYIWNSVHGFINNRIKYPDLPWKSDEQEVNNLVNLILFGIIEK